MCGVVGCGGVGFRAVVCGGVVCGVVGCGGVGFRAVVCGGVMFGAVGCGAVPPPPEKQNQICVEAPQYATPPHP